MTIGGWIIMIFSVGSVTALFLTCLYKVLSGAPNPEHLHGMDIDTRDTED